LWSSVPPSIDSGAAGRYPLHDLGASVSDRRPRAQSDRDGARSESTTRPCPPCTFAYARQGRRLPRSQQFGHDAAGRGGAVVFRHLSPSFRVSDRKVLFPHRSQANHGEMVSQGNGESRGLAGAAPRSPPTCRQPLGRDPASDAAGIATTPFPPPRPTVRPCRVHGRCGLWPRRRDGGAPPLGRDPAGADRVPVPASRRSPVSGTAREKGAGGGARGGTQLTW
jgi:hypothetical protein